MLACVWIVSSGKAWPMVLFTHRAGSAIPPGWNQVCCPFTGGIARHGRAQPATFCDRFAIESTAWETSPAGWDPSQLLAGYTTHFAIVGHRAVPAIDIGWWLWAEDKESSWFRDKEMRIRF
jgi:hypothetical protein